MSYVVYVLTEIIVRLSEKDCLGCKDGKKSRLLHLCSQVFHILFKSHQLGNMYIKPDVYQVSLLGHFMKYYEQARDILMKNMGRILERHEIEYDKRTMEEIVNFLKWSSPQSIYYGNPHFNIDYFFGTST